MAEAKKDPIYQPRVVTIEGYTPEDLDAKVTEALAGRYKNFEKVGAVTYGGNQKVFYQGLKEKAETTEPEPDPGTGGAGE
ncbi:hypothetical protein NIAMH_29 [Serratia phage vB_SmaS_Niamh]|uniref:Uncharacterized protein n=1 Tax=Serratia phage vB_SmaS_Ulliraptor TaxID=2902694 RepID=A0AC61TP35_9CAUD|nr:hypothetical protein QJS27_gp28 [Serratia phage vB_SmaS_Ulliraptor]QPX74396.1 hypothetical protein SERRATIANATOR_40 [Serratia phage vB_SmaS_Serratianator]UGO52020.1 hypothetical protein ULLIRAPTOR_28 [Serratia phage vB_SmaS_Ulliraptor]UGO52983.1 hypothetical protein NIAMH_29 [Serratia phage vB_SmaS_Niamh]